MQANTQHTTDTRRSAIVVVVLMVATLFLMWRAIDLHVFRKDFLQGQGDARYLRVVPVPANRGMITDRHGEPLAISTPVESIWANPKELLQASKQLPKLVGALQIDGAALQRRLLALKDKEFIYLKRWAAPDVVAKVMALGIPGVALQSEYRRYYPSGEVTAHVVGFTNIDDQGQEGVELAYDSHLRSRSGSKLVIKDRLGQIVENVELVNDPRPGEDLVLSIDRRIQYLAYRELKAAVIKHNADAGTAVVLDAKTGEILAMVNQPAYNPNNRSDLDTAHLRNRAVTDVFEPGSTVKPFIIAAALESGDYQPTTMIDTNPGLMRVGKKIIRDIRNYGRINVATVIKKSSNVGASKIALSLDPRRLWQTLAGVGFGELSGSGFPGEVKGQLTDFGRWRPIERATLSFGYGMSVTALQLARAYAVFASDKQLPKSTLLRKIYPENAAQYDTRSMLSRKTIMQVRAMLESVVTNGGTGSRARVPGYRIAGKTGTVKKIANGEYLDDSYLAVFAGIAPVSDPRLVMVVMIDEPRGEQYYGGAVAAPVFSKVIGGALRMLDVPPDNFPTLKGTRLALMDERK